MGIFSRVMGVDRFLINDTEKALSAIKSLPSETQSLIADFVGKELTKTLDQFEGSVERRAALEKSLARAKQLRQLALMSGASDYKDPQWAAAALIESIFMAAHPKISSSTFAKVSRAVRGWAVSALNEAEYARLRFDKIPDLDL